MSDKIIKDNSKERVAYDLMTKINSVTSNTEEKKADPVSYFLKLYRKCYKATSGYSIPDILSEND